MSENRLIEVMSALCLALMTGLMWLTGATTVAFVLVGAGAALMVAVCVMVGANSGAG